MVQITTAHVASPLVMPTADELRALYKIVLAKYPKLDPERQRDRDQAGFDAQFRRTFWAAGQLGRLPDVETHNIKATSYWCQLTGDILQNAGKSALEVPGNIFVIAVLAHGDVPHSLDPARYPFDFSLGLTFPSAGVPATDVWRRVLSTSNLRPASPTPFRHGWSPGAVRVDNRGYRETPIGFVSSTSNEY